MIIADTGFWLAIANRKDRFHLQAVEALTQVKESLIVTWAVMTETCHLLQTRLGTNAQTSFIQSYKQGAFEVFTIEIHHANRLIELMKKYEDLPMDLADASLVLLAEELKEGGILSTDQRDFQTYRWKNRHPFENLLLS